MPTQDVQGPGGDAGGGGVGGGHSLLSYRAAADDRLIERRVADGCLYQLFATFVTLGCLVGFFAFAWLAVALLLLAMYPQPGWSMAERGWVGFTSFLTGVASVVCFIGALHSAPIRWRKG
jgi:hypothetical protein